MIDNELERGDVAVIVPRRSDNGGRCDVLWKFTLAWIKTHHPGWAVVTGDSPEGPFNRGAALNDAAVAAIAQGAQVLVVHDEDNITSPERLEEAVRRAHEDQRAWFPSDCYFYLDEESSTELMRLDDCYEECHHFWPRPAEFREPGYNALVHNKYISGILAVPTSAWQAAGGFVPLKGRGRGDLIFWPLLEHYGKMPAYLEGTTLHLHHDHKEEDTREIKQFTVALSSLNKERVLAKVRAGTSYE